MTELVPSGLPPIAVKKTAIVSKMSSMITEEVEPCHHLAGTDKGPLNELVKLKNESFVKTQ